MIAPIYLLLMIALAVPLAAQAEMGDCRLVLQAPRDPITGASIQPVTTSAMLALADSGVIEPATGRGAVAGPGQSNAVLVSPSDVLNSGRTVAAPMSAELAVEVLSVSRDPVSERSVNVVAAVAADAAVRAHAAAVVDADPAGRLVSAPPMDCQI